jgi:two-component system, OmpR family, sensor histidine kinase BaeS
MTNRPNRRTLGIGELGRRLIAAFIIVALAALAVDIGTAAVTADIDLDRLVTQQDTEQAKAAAAAAGGAYAGRHGWISSRLTPVIVLLDRTNDAVQVHDAAGKVIRSSPGFASASAARQRSAPVIERGRQVGSVVVRFGSGGIGAATTEFKQLRWRSRIYAAIVAVLVALAVSVFMARQITVPLERVLAAMRARAWGDRSVRIVQVREVGVLGELLEVFNASANELDRRDRVQRNLIADTAHELRTPVAVLQAGHEAMLDGITEPSQESIGSLREEVLRLGRVLEDLQALAAAEAAAIQLNLVAHDLAEIAADTAASLAGAFEMRSLTLQTEVAQVDVMCDYARMRDIISNLLTNAMKYSASGGMVTVAAGPYDRDRARLTVRDTGIGITAEDLPQVTDRFFRGKRSQQMAAGTGFGLTIVSELVRAHHGELEIASEPGLGTEVTITLPRARGVAPPAGTDPAPGPAARSGARPAALRLDGRVELDHLGLDWGGNVRLDVLGEPGVELTLALPHLTDVEAAGGRVRDVNYEAGLLLDQVGQLVRYLVIRRRIHPGDVHPHHYSHVVPPMRECLPP